MACSSSEKPTVSIPDPGEAYRSQLGDIIDQYQAAYNEVGDLNEQMGNNPALLKDGDWNKKHRELFLVATTPILYGDDVQTVGRN